MYHKRPRPQQGQGWRKGGNYLKKFFYGEKKVKILHYNLIAEDQRS